MLNRQFQIPHFCIYFSTFPLSISLIQLLIANLNNFLEQITFLLLFSFFHPSKLILFFFIFLIIFATISLSLFILCHLHLNHPFHDHLSLAFSPFLLLVKKVSPFNFSQFLKLTPSIITHFIIILFIIYADLLIVKFPLFIVIVPLFLFIFVNQNLRTLLFHLLFNRYYHFFI